MYIRFHFNLFENIRKTLGGLFVIMFGVIILLFHLLIVKKSKEVKTWKTVQGTIIESTIDRSHRSRCSRPSSRRALITIKTCRDVTLYKPHIMYEYTVKGQKYTSNSIRLNDFSWSKSAMDATNVILSYPLDSTVSVYYNKNNPSESYLNTEYNSIPFIISIVTILIGLMIIFLGSDDY